MEPSFDDQDPEVSSGVARSWQEASPLPALLRLISDRPDAWDLDLL